MASFNILYTHQKTKKAKVWQDGVLSVIDSSKREIYDMKGSRIDCLYSTKEVKVGDEYETDKYLIMVDSLVTSFPSHATQSKTAVSDIVPRPAFNNKLANYKSRKGFNPPKRLPAAHTLTEEEPSSKLQNIESSKPASLFSTYSQLPPYKHVKKAENVPTSFTAEPTSMRSVKDILTLISSMKTDERNQPTAGVSARYAAGVNSLRIMQPEPPSTVECTVPLPSSHADNSAQGSLWDEFLSQEANAQAEILAGQSPHSHSHHGMTTPSHAGRHMGQSGNETVKMLGYVDECVSSNSSSKGGQRSKQLTIDTPTVGGKRCLSSTGLPNCPLLVGSDHNRLAAGRSAELSSPLYTALPTCGNLGTSAVPNHCGERALPNDSVSRASTTAIDARLGLADSPSTQESPQTANFSLGSLSTELGDDLSQSSSLDAPVTNKINSGGTSKNLSAQVKTTSTGCTGKLQVKEPLMVTSPASDDGASGSRVVHEISAACVPEPRNDIFDVLRSCNVDDLYSTSLSDLDDSLNDSPCTKPVTPATTSLSASNVWSAFTSPSKKPPKVHTQSIFDQPGSGTNSDRVWLTNGVEAGLGGSYCDTRLVPPTPGSSVFGATLPADKVMLARDKVMMNTGSSNAGDVHRAPISTSACIAESRKVPT